MKINYFARAVDNYTQTYYITKIDADTIYYGYYKPNHQNTKATACMVTKYFKYLCNQELIKTW